ncbi:hypothetical protein, partial [Ralstonia mannitolilytica]|uniref:hypothetical protein n=1 Tax=Ralstonia mannitolilytica TaxID=105219 RepID=UPI0039B4650B
MLKNFAINFVYRVAALSAAEKRDYAELFRRCQQLAEEIFSFNSPLTSSRHPAGQQLQPPGNPHHSYFSTASHAPPSLSFRRCVVQRGANIRGV